MSASGGAIIVMFHEASGKKKIRMASYLTSWNQADHQRNTEKTGQIKIRNLKSKILQTRSRVPGAMEK